MIKLSVVIITLNEERNLERCLRSVQDVADEIVIVDSLSTDRTIEIAKTFGSKIISKAFDGYVKQRRFADAQATHDWVLAIDADEALSPELAASIRQVKAAPKFNAYKLSRLNNYCGKWIKHGGWYPDKKTRLFDRSKGNWQGEMVHEYWELQDSTQPVGNLHGDLLHYSFYTISEHIRQIEKFTEMSARAAVAQGRDCSKIKILLGPAWAFFTMYILKLGFLDGYYGMLFCRLSASATLIKYSKIRQYAAAKRGEG
jgi:glycosyltransferase involved in cell wall biosynthesis